MQELLIILVIGALAVGAFLFFSKSGGPPNADKPRFLTPENKARRHKLRLMDKMHISHDVRRFRLQLPSANMVLGLPPGKHIQVFGPNPAGEVAGQWNGREDKEAGDDEIMRKYTPTTSDFDAVGHVDLVLKIYNRRGFPGAVDRFPDGGKMSQYLETLQIGDEVTIKGPVGLHEYLGKGVFKDGRETLKAKNIGMIAGGTGVTPMLQIVKAVLDNPADKSNVWLLFANQTERDILVRDYLEEYMRKFPGRMKLWYTLDRPPPLWIEGTMKDGIGRSAGFINEEMIKDALPPPSSDTVILCCGPPPMIDYACKPNLQKAGHPKERVIVF